MAGWGRLPGVSEGACPGKSEFTADLWRLLLKDVFSGECEFHAHTVLFRRWAPTGSGSCRLCHVCGQQVQLPEGFPLMTKRPYLPDGHVMDEHLTASRTPELIPSACTTLLLAGTCLAIQS